MAKENYISLKGQLRTDVHFVTDEETGEDICALFPLLVLRRDTRDLAGNLNPKFDRPIVSTSDPMMIRRAKKLQKYDIVEVKGTFRTQFSTRNKYCDKCGELNTVETSIQTVNPVFIGVLSSECKNDTDGTSYLLDVAEVSNVAKIIGRVCSATENLKLSETEQGTPFCKYQLAVNRKLYIPDSVDEQDHTDYPIVYSYGSVAEDDVQVLQQNALIYLDGYIRTSTVNKTMKCACCGKDFIVQNKRMTISPYSNEYLRDFKGDVLESTHTTEQIKEYETEEGEKL